MVVLRERSHLPALGHGGTNRPGFPSAEKIPETQDFEGLKRKECEVSQVELVTLAARAACFFLCLHPFDML